MDNILNNYPANNEEKQNELDNLNDDDAVEGIEVMERIFKNSVPNTEPKPKLITSPVPIVRPIVTIDKQLNEMEMSKLIELNMAAHDILDYVKFKTDQIVEVDDLNQLNHIVDQGGVFDRNIRSTVNFCKGITKFVEITKSDQKILFNNIWKVTMIKKVPAFNFEDEHWTYSLVSLNLFVHILL